MTCAKVGIIFDISNYFEIKLANLRNISYLCPVKQNYRKMLGIDSPHAPVEGKFAKEIRATVQRVSTDLLNEADKRRIRRSRKILKKFDAVWE